MSLYQIDNCMGIIADKIREWIQKGVFNNKRVLLYGLDAYSYGMHSILSNHGIYAEGYLCDDEVLKTKTQRSMKGFASRYLSDKDSLVKIWSIPERLDRHEEDVVILVASKQAENVIEKLSKIGYKTGTQVFIAYDWTDDEFERLVVGKKRLTSTEVKQVLKNLLQILDSFCRDNKINYWVCGGTLLGTIRHSGFIPWDDDIDVLMKWDDYLRFMHSFPDSELFSVVGLERTPRSECFLPFGKILDKRTIIREDSSFLRIVCPVSLDIFPLVGVPGDALKRKSFFFYYKEILNEAWEDYYANDGDLSAHERMYSRQREFFTKYDANKSDYVGVLGTVYWERDFTRREVYETTLRMQFEDIEVNVPGGYREYLDNLYGESWMTPPPVEERKSHHFENAYFMT